MMKKRAIIILLYSLLFLGPIEVKAEERCVPASLRGATIFLPVYSHISHGDKLRPFNLAVTISLRNTDAATPVTITGAEYYDANGKLIRNLVPNPVALMPLHSIEYKIKESDVAGGSGGSVVLKWSSQKPASPLLAESIMIGTSSAQGLSYSSRGQITAFEP